VERPHIDEQAAEEALRSVRIPVLLEENVERGTVLVHRSPEPVLLAADLQRHLIRMPGATPSTPVPAWFLGIAAAELGDPAAHAFVAGADTTLRQHLLQIPEAEGKRR